MGGDRSVVLTIPAGWDASAPDNGTTGTDIRKHRDEPGELTLSVDGSDDIRVYAGVCDTQDVPPRAGPTVDDLVSALRAQEGSETSEPVDVTIGGRAVKRYEITFGGGPDHATCGDGIARVWYSDASGYLASSGPEPHTATIHMVQTDAGRLVFQFSHADDASAEDVAELDAIVESMVIEP